MDAVCKAAMDCEAISPLRYYARPALDIDGLAHCRQNMTLIAQVNSDNRTYTPSEWESAIFWEYVVDTPSEVTTGGLPGRNWQTTTHYWNTGEDHMSTICPHCGHRIRCLQCDNGICEACGADLYAEDSIPFTDVNSEAIISTTLESGEPAPAQTEGR